LRESDLGELATCRVEDNATFQLLDGSDYKDVGQLSTGQRCTVILPIVLEHRDRILIVDQPEDHIDNAFIADTLIKALRRPADGQIILSTHNPNIPVLGEAQEVVHLGSDGQHGFVLTAAPLDDERIVTAITNVMEGGIEAFQKRARFYRSRGK
jgi:ABC-type Mn2+/Zn2+ transport system ATPase subunit